MLRGNGQIGHSNAARTAWNAGSHPHRASVTSSSGNGYNPRLFGAHAGNPGSKAQEVSWLRTSTKVGNRSVVRSCKR
jgi:hypothetical protein